VPIQGFTRFRKRQWGYQGSNSSVINTKATATRVIPWKGVPVVNLNLTWPDQDEGSLDPITAPYQTASDITAAVAGPLNYNDAVYLFDCGLLGGVVVAGGGAAKTWTYQPPSLTASPLGMFTEEYGDDVLTDWWQLTGGIMEDFTLTGDNSMGPLQLAGNMRYAQWKSTGSTDHPVSGTVPTAALVVDASPTPIFLGDMELLLDPTAAAIGTTKITDAVEGIVLSVKNTLDKKRYANGSNTRFAVQGYGLSGREITLELTLAKTSQTVGVLQENDLWFDDTPAKRFCELRFTSPVIITGSTPYSLSIRLPYYYITRADGANGNNAQIMLTGKAVYDATLTYAIRASVVNNLATR
jgi:hypothetical protein